MPLPASAGSWRRPGSMRRTPWWNTPSRRRKPETRNVLDGAALSRVDGRDSDPRVPRSGDDEAWHVDGRRDRGHATGDGPSHGRGQPALLGPLLRGEGSELGTREVYAQGVGEGLDDRVPRPAEVSRGHRVVRAGPSRS